MSCSDEISQIKDTSCGEGYSNGINKIYTKQTDKGIEVYDEWKNLIGYGVFKDGTLIVDCNV